MLLFIFPTSTQFRFSSDFDVIFAAMLLFERKYQVSLQLMIENVFNIIDFGTISTNLMLESTLNETIQRAEKCCHRPT